MAASKTVRKYNVTQPELYVICRIGWYSCEEYLADFAAFKTFYTPEYVAAAIEAINHAQGLPDEGVRNEMHESLHIQLLQAADDCTTAWRKLRRYITSAFAPGIVNAVIDASGKKEYKLSENSNWPSMIGMMTAGSKTITEHLTELTAAGMTAGFPAEFEAARAAFKVLYEQLKGAQQDGRELTNEKIIANNDIYTSLQAMFADGQAIYGKNYARHKRFVFERVKKLVRVG